MLHQGTDALLRPRQRHLHRTLRGDNLPDLLEGEQIVPVVRGRGDFFREGGLPVGFLGLLKPEPAGGFHEVFKVGLFVLHTPLTHTFRVIRKPRRLFDQPLETRQALAEHAILGS